MESDTRKDFRISYTSGDRTWAEWIDWLLEQAGYIMVIQTWIFRLGSNFVFEMNSTAEGNDDQRISSYENPQCQPLNSIDLFLWDCLHPFLLFPYTESTEAMKGRRR